MERKDFLKVLKDNIQNPNLIKHSLAVEAGMRALAEYFQEDQEKWGICGLLHDIDYEKTKDNPELHSKLGSEMLRKMGLEKEICQAVLTHNEAHGILPSGKMAQALFCLDPLTGLIVASTLVLPSGKIKDIKVENILNRFREKNFARGVNRENIRKCEEYLGLSLAEFIKIVLSAMQKISDQLGL